MDGHFECTIIVYIHTYISTHIRYRVFWGRGMCQMVIDCGSEWIWEEKIAKYVYIPMEHDSRANG